MNFRKQRARSRRNSINIMTVADKWKNISRKKSRRDSDSEDDEDEEDAQLSEVDWEQEFLQDRLNRLSSDQDSEVQLTKKQTLLLATLLPDEIIQIENFDSTEPKRFVGVLLMADVSGYTALSERYNTTGKGGTYRLTATLNAYLGSLIELIYNHGGDILKFAGDAFLALWKTDKRTFLCHTIHTAIACALLIQHSFSSYETDVKISLKVKLAISAGNLLFATIGNQIPMNYVIFGLPVIEAKLAESLCISGEVKLTPNAWGHCYSRNYDFVIEENGHVTIRAILYDPRDSDVSKPFRGLGAMIKTKRNFAALENLPDSVWTSPKCSSAENAIKYEALDFRQKILLAEERNIGPELRKFMIRPVLTQIDALQPLEYLTEMRQVSVLFVTLKPRNCPHQQLITIVNNSYETMCEIVYKSMGCVNKIILFDKDIMILIIFGLRGFKHECEAQAALKCACGIKKSVSALDGVREVSIGVTTGQVYCGVVGHPLRREYTVIGATVNKAARLMCYFRDKITCDEATFVNSKMSSNGFTLQPSVDLKGILHAGKIFEYSEDIRVKELYDIPMIPRLLNRADEIEYFENWLDDAHHAYRDFDALLLVGEPGIGKTRLIEWMARHARGCGHNVCSLTLTSIHSATPYLALTQIINQILGLSEPIEDFKKEERIVQLLKVYDEDLCFLNDVIKTRFAYHEGVYSQDAKQREERAKIIFSKVIQSIPDTHVIFLDDLQSLDQVSWEYISIMINSQNIFTITTVRRGKVSSVQAWLYNVFTNNNIRKIILGPLSPKWIPSLACQILDVAAVSNDLCKALQSKCKGIPGIMELFIIHLFSSGALEINRIQELELEEYRNDELQFPPAEFLHPQALNIFDQPTLDDLIQENKTEEIGICRVTEKEKLKTNINVETTDALIMMQIDALTPYQQLLLKIGSVIGDVMSRDLLENIMYENNTITTAKAIKRFFAMQILSCANTANRWHRRSTRASLNSSITSVTPLPLPACECTFEFDPELSFGLPKYAFCKLLRFKGKKIRNTFYELLPMNQKKEFHARIVTYLESNKHKCRSCGGIIMVVQSLTDLEDETEKRIFNESSKGEDNGDEDSKSQEPFTISNTEKNNSESRSTSVTDVPTEKLHTSFTSANSQTVPILKSNKEDSIGRRRSTKRVTVSSFVFKNGSSYQLDTFNVFDMLRKVTEAESMSDWHELGVIDSDDEDSKNKELFSIKIEKGVSETDFSRCTCAELKLTIYEQMIYHASKAEMKFKEIELTIELCYLYLLASNVDDALLKLEHVESLFNLPEVQEIIDSWDIKRFLGKIYTLKAAGCLAIANHVAAKVALGKAVRIYHINIDNVAEFLKLRSLVDKVKIKGKKYRLNEAKMVADSILCLNICTLLYSALGDGTAARFHAYRALKLVQKVECNVVDLCDVFSNAIHVDLVLGFIESTADTLHLAISKLQSLQQPFQSEDLYALGKVFMASFRAGVARGALASAIKTAFRAMAVSRFLRAYNVSMEIIPDLFYILLCRRRISEAVDVLKEASIMSKERSSLDCETWYYALCIDLILDTGFQLETPTEISRYAEYAIQTPESNAGRRRLMAGLWTYWLRADQERRAKRFEAEVLAWVSREEEDGSLTTLISSMRLAEGMLESLARKMDDLRKVVDLMELRSLADQKLVSLEHDAKLCRVIYPRWITLRANSLYLSGRRSAATTTFNQALEEARKVHNRLEEAITLAATGHSTIWLSNARSGRFITWRDGYQLARESWHRYLYRITANR
ncbi:adenylate cyclase type 10-like [Leguminivora glycinivorella]|uniref:adenylate cyclase type 10-like n=1 Tax=Leguminivora glycinivorella TaxID=1035111 RepID=UPI00201005B0|nr:adenylate cyclase type 10-like [Leguminivora glycinivorella]